MSYFHSTIQFNTSWEESNCCNNEASTWSHYRARRTTIIQTQHKPSDISGSLSFELFLAHLDCDPKITFQISKINHLRYSRKVTGTPLSTIWDVLFGCIWHSYLMMYPFPSPHLLVSWFSPTDTYTHIHTHVYIYIHSHKPRPRNIHPSDRSKMKITTGSVSWIRFRVLCKIR